MRFSRDSWDQAEAYNLLFALLVDGLGEPELRRLQRDVLANETVTAAARSIAAETVDFAIAKLLADPSALPDWLELVRDDPAFAVRKVQSLLATVDLLEAGAQEPPDFSALIELAEFVGGRPA